MRSIATLIFTGSALLFVGCGDRSTTAASTRVPPPPNATGRGSADRMGVPQDRIAREVRHELVMLPYYGVFDDLSYRVDGGTVTLFGAVTRPTLKSDAENVVKRIEGVDRVV